LNVLTIRFVRSKLKNYHRGKREEKKSVKTFYNLSISVQEGFWKIALFFLWPYDDLGNLRLVFIFLPPRRQFHQHFTCAFFVRKFVQSKTLSREKLLNLLLYEKCSCKMLMKLTPGEKLTCTRYLKAWMKDKKERGKRSTNRRKKCSKLDLCCRTFLKKVGKRHINFITDLWKQCGNNFIIKVYTAMFF